MNASDTPTPRTDAHCGWVPADFARTLERELAEARKQARAEALEEAAKVCEQMQEEKDKLFSARNNSDGWKTLGSTEIGGYTFASSIRALSAQERKGEG